MGFDRSGSAQSMQGGIMKLNQPVLAAMLAAGLIGAAAAEPIQTPAAPKAVDIGTLATAGNSTLTVTVPMKLRDPEQLNLLLQAVYTPGDPQFHHFLSKREFAQRFGPDDETVARLTRHFQSQGLVVARTATAQLQVTGSVAAIQRAFGVQLHGYEVPATAATRAYRFHSPIGRPQLAPEISASIHGVLGLDSRPRFQSQAVRAVKAPMHGAASKSGVSPQEGTGPVNPYGQLTVADFAQLYDVTPLYQSGFKGENRTIGIVTLAAFTPSDAFKYWDSLGLTTDPARIREIQIDGGSGPASDQSGSCETTLDVEQSGGVAPAAKLVIYEAPNTEQGWLDAFAASVDDNAADTVSTSWSTWEFFASKDDLEDSTVTDPVNGRRSTMLNALNDVLTQAALQGQSMFAASGDHGAYASQGHFDFPISNTLTAEFPAAEPLITAAGGTTLPRGLFEEFPDEAAWGWDYLFFFPIGSGGGVSSYFARPPYQLGIPGMLNTEPGQVQITFTLNDTGGVTPDLRIVLPTNFAGRNIPDLSLNSDPETGYTVFYTSDVSGFSVIEGFGGTSFASPQLNGVTALFDQAVGKRVGLLNFPLYDLARRNLAYGGATPPLRDITLGDNWHYTAQPGYDQASGLGVPDFANLLKALKRFIR
jgi:kumamolisin